MTYKTKYLICKTCKDRTLLTLETLDSWDYADNTEQGCTEFRVWEWFCAGCQNWKAQLMIDNSAVVMVVEW